MMPARAGIARAAVMVAAVTVLARVVGFARVLVFARTVGPTCLGDAYYTANTAPNILFDVVAGGALTSIVVPLLAGRVDAADDAAADRAASALLTWSLVLLLPVTVAGMLLAHPLMSLLVGNGHPGCSAAAERDVGARMLVVFMPQVLLYGVGIVLTGVLQAHRRFLAPAVAPLLSSLVVIAAYVTFAVVAVAPEHGLVHLARAHELVLSIGTTAGVLALVAPLMVPLRATGRRLRPTLHFPPGAAATARRLAIAGAVVLGSQDLATAAVLRLANDRGSDGAVVLVNLAWTVFLLPWAVVAVPVATTAFPELVARWQSGDLMRFAGTAAASARTVLLACAGAAALLVACAAPGARVVVLGAPGHVAPDQLAHAFVAFAPGLIGYGATALLSRVLYARDDVRTPAAATAVGWALAVAVDVALVLAWSRSSAAAAIGVGTSIGTTAAAVLMGLRLRRSAPAALAGVVRSGSAALAAAVTGGAIGVLAAAALPAAGVTTSIAETVVAGVICLATFVAVLWWLDRPTLRLVLGRVAHAR